MASTRGTCGGHCARTSTSRAISGDLRGIMADHAAVRIANFSHVCIGVSDIEKSLGFYRDVLGMDLVFDVALEGGSLEAVTGREGERGRMVGGLIGGTMVELLALGAVPSATEAPHIGYTNISLRVED